MIDDFIKHDCNLALILLSSRVGRLSSANIEVTLEYLAKRHSCSISLDIF